MKILIAEDSEALAQWLARALADQGYGVECIGDGKDVDERLQEHSFDLVILDLALPRMDGREILDRLRIRRDFVPVLILTANNSIEGRVGCLDLGADDYLGKPFDLVELEARIRALLRRTRQHGEAGPSTHCGSLVLDAATRRFHLGRSPLALTPREHTILESLLMKVDRTVSKRALAGYLHTLNEQVSSEAIEIYVHRLRKKLASSDVAIITVRGLGYLLKHRGVA